MAARRQQLAGGRLALGAGGGQAAALDEPHGACCAARRARSLPVTRRGRSTNRAPLQQYVSGYDRTYPSTARYRRPGSGAGIRAVMLNLVYSFLKKESLPFPLPGVRP
eukprot:SAG31_NODE_1835_length_7130_cov_6.218746_1_plen_107_part_10